VAVAALWVLELAYAGAWLFVVPAALPALDLSPWSGWTTFDELDLLILAMFAGSYARIAWRGQFANRWRTHRLQPPAAAALLFGAFSLLAFWRGVNAGGGWSFGWYQDETGTLNSLRVAKSSLYAGLALPLVLGELRKDEQRTLRRVGLGMLCGLAVVSIAALSERVSYPGLLNLTSRYRTTALFWEMRVGGGAIDAYLALATPFVAWALWSGRPPGRWLAAALLALLAAYACLTTFSRGLYIALAVSLLMLGLLLLARRADLDASSRWRRGARLALVNVFFAALLVAAYARRGYPGLALVLLALGALGLFVARAAGLRMAAAAGLAVALMGEGAVFATGSFMLARLTAVEDDYGNRLEHWQAGVATLDSLENWLFGRGLGRLPALYAALPASELSGRIGLVDADGSHAVRIEGPATQRRLGGLYGLTQRVALSARYRAQLDVRAVRPTDLVLQVCERHLLYDRRCQGVFVRLVRTTAGWQRIDVALHGPPVRAGEWITARTAVFELSVVNAGGEVETRRLALTGPDGRPLLRNGDLIDGLAHWQRAAQEYFVPWHIDNLYLELLVERGAPALLAFLALAFIALRSGWRATAPAAPFMLAALVGGLVVGGVSSVLDTPRVAFLLQLLMLILVLLGRARIHACPVRGATSVHAGDGRLDRA
jgi:O-antigen ligase